MKFLLTLFGLLFAALAMAQLPAFPGAQGWGSGAVGGRGGVVMEVTNLNDAGPGSFRNAVETASGARTVVFRIGGVIDLLSEIQISNPFIYIAAQTAPGDGIVLKNFGIAIFTHDVIIRGLRIRVGDEFPALLKDNGDCVAIQSGSFRVILDHCSFSWGSDENVSIWGPSADSVTVQWCIISEGLYASLHPKGHHSMAMIIGNDATHTSVHHNLVAHNAGRNPLIMRRTDHEFVSNLVYDWGYSSELYEQGTQLKLDFAGNYFMPFSDKPFPELPLKLDFDSSTQFGSRLYMVNNYYSAGTYFITPQQLSTMGGNAIVFSSSSLLSKPSTVTLHSPFEARDTILKWAGALHPQRDATDLRVLKSVTDSTGGMLDCINPIVFLDSGNVIGATDTSLIYSQFGKPIYYSTESRRIEITGGKGAGQIRYGDYGISVLDTQNVILEGKITVPWTIKPDATSKYKFYAGCNNALGSFPAYVSGTPPTDTDHDGMPDAWEIAHGLNPADPTDRNGTTLDTSGYTNLEVFLNGYYLNSNTGIYDLELPEISIRIFPNPWSSVATVQLNRRLVGGEMKVFNLFGEMVRTEDPFSERKVVERGELRAGIYFIEITEGGRLVGTGKMMVVD